MLFASLSVMHTETGRLGEAWVANWFEWQGFNIKARRLMTPYGELDLWVSQGVRHYLVEVKTRSQDVSSASPDVYGLTQVKKQRYLRIRHYICATNPDLQQVICALVLLTPRNLYWLPDLFVAHPRFSVCSTKAMAKVFKIS